MQRYCWLIILTYILSHTISKSSRTNGQTLDSDVKCLSSTSLNYSQYKCNIYCNFLRTSLNYRVKHKSLSEDALSTRDDYCAITLLKALPNVQQFRELMTGTCAAGQDSKYVSKVLFFFKCLNDLETVELTALSLRSGRANRANATFQSCMFHTVLKQAFKKRREMLYYFVNNSFLFSMVKTFSKSVNN